MMRLQKYIAHCGAASRRHAERLITDGRIKVNGETVFALGSSVDETRDIVELDGERIEVPEVQNVYILNKPLGVVSTMDDPQKRPTVGDIIRENELAGYFPIGRLDKETSGLLPITNDGDLAHKLMHPSHNIPKTYEVKIDGALKQSDIKALECGIDIGGFVTSSASVEVVGRDKKTSNVHITIHEGKNRQVRRMFAKLGFRVLKLRRISYGQLGLGTLGVGELRLLSFEEREALVSE